METFQAAVLQPNKERTGRVLSYIGGTPTKGAQAWPMNPENPAEALSHLIQLDCAELSEAVPGNPLPPHGVLQFFLDFENFVNTDERPACRVVWQAQPVVGEALSLPEVPGRGALTSLFGKRKAEIAPPPELPRVALDLQPIETSCEKVMQDVADLRGMDMSRYNPETIGPWHFWHQALGRLPPDLGGGPESLLQGPGNDVLLLRLVEDAGHGFDWNGFLNPSLSFWIAQTDLEAGRWDTAYALFTDF